MSKLLVVQVGLLALSVAVLQGCTSTGMASGAKAQAEKIVDGTSTARLPVGKSYSATPPRLVREKVSWGKDKPRQAVAWDNTERFGPVPKNLVKEGEAVCKAVGGSHARGYHPRALGVNGKPIPDGSFLCS